MTTPATRPPPPPRGWDSVSPADASVIEVMTAADHSNKTTTSASAARDVALYDGDARVRDVAAAQLHLTPTRLLWIAAVDDAGAGEALALPLARIASVSSTQGFSLSNLSQYVTSLPKSSPKIVLQVNVPAEAPTSVATTAADTSVNPSSSSDVIPQWVCAICASLNPTTISKCETCGVVNKTSSPPQTKQAQQVSDQPGRCPTCTFVNHVDMRICEMCETPLNTGATPLSTTAPSATTVTPTASAAPTLVTIKLSFRSGGMNEFLTALRTAIADRKWENQPSSSTPSAASARATPVVPAPPVGGTSVGGGIAGIIKSIDQSKKQTDDTLSQAFKDLDGLMGKAGDMVRLAESISARLASQQQPSSTESSEIAAFRSYLVNLGISTPVTRELAELLDKILTPQKDMIPLIDLYCLYNRARGIALVSPADLQRATDHFQDLKLPFRVRRFTNSGLSIVERADGPSDHVVAERCGRLIAGVFEGGGCTAAQFADVVGCGVVLAREQLLMAEGSGFVCRDDSIEGLRFFENRFLHAFA